MIKTIADTGSYIDPGLAAVLGIVLTLVWLVQVRRELVADRRSLRRLARRDEALVLDLSVCAENGTPDDEVKREQSKRNGKESNSKFSHARSVSARRV